MRVEFTALSNLVGLEESGELAIDNHFVTHLELVQGGELLASEIISAVHLKLDHALTVGYLVGCVSKALGVEVLFIDARRNHALDVDFGRFVGILQGAVILVVIDELVRRCHIERVILGSAALGISGDRGVVIRSLSVERIELVALGELIGVVELGQLALDNHFVADLELVERCKPYAAEIISPVHLKLAGGRAIVGNLVGRVSVLHRVEVGFVDASRYYALDVDRLGYIVVARPSVLVNQPERGGHAVGMLGGTVLDKVTLLGDCKGRLVHHVAIEHDVGLAVSPFVGKGLDGDGLGIGRSRAAGRADAEPVLDALVVALESPVHSGRKLKSIFTALDGEFVSRF